MYEVYKDCSVSLIHVYVERQWMYMDCSVLRQQPHSHLNVEKHQATTDRLRPTTLTKE